MKPYRAILSARKYIEQSMATLWATKTSQTEEDAQQAIEDLGLVAEVLRWVLDEEPPTIERLAGELGEACGEEPPSPTEPSVN